MKITQREMTLSVVTLAAVLGGVTWYMVDSKVEEWRSKAGTIEKTEQQIRHYEAAIKMQENWLDELNALQDELRVFSITQRNVSPELMKIVKEISARHELDITRSQPYPEKPTGDLFELGINCTWQGPLDAMVGFLAELQKQGVNYDVRQLNVTPVGKNTGKLKGNMVIHCAYTKKPPDEIEEKPERNPVTPERNPVTPESNPVTPESSPVTPERNPVTPERSPSQPEKPQNT